MTVTTSAIEPGSAAATAATRMTRLQRLAAVLALVAIGEALAIVRFGTAGDPRFSIGLDLATFAFVGSVILFPLVGALIVQRRPTTRVAWLMIAIGLTLGIGLMGYGYGTIGMPPRPALPGALATLVLSELFFVPAVATGSTLLFLLFPSDRFLAPRWQWVALLSIAGAAAFVAGSMTLPGEINAENFPGVANPLGLPAELRAAAEAAIIGGNTALVTSAVLGAVSLVLRYRQGDRTERAQIRWIALVGSLAAACFAVAATQIDAVSSAGWELGFTSLALMPIAIGVAITRYHLYDIDRLINRALVYGSLSAILAGVFTAGIGLAQRVFIATTGQSSDAAVVAATLVVATIYAPLRKRLESIVDRRFKYDQLRFGAYRDEVARVLSIVEPVHAAQRLVDEAVSELQAVGAAVLATDGSVTATAGEWPVPPVVRLAIPASGPRLATVIVGPRGDGEPHDPPTVAQLEEMTRLVGAAVRPVEGARVEARVRL